MSKKKVLTRRDFIVGTTAGAAGMALGLPRMAGGAINRSESRSSVVLVRHKDVMDDAGNIDGSILASMLDDAVCALIGMDDPMACWKTLLKPDDILGIKSNVWTFLPTPRELENALKERAMKVGIPEKNIGIKDRGLLSDPLFPKATALINTRPLRTHHWSGIGGCLKNYITFHSQPYTWHGDSCADLGGLWKLPVCANKTRLNILVVLRPLFYGIGPHHFDPKHVWPYKGLLVSTDPVSCDALGVKLLEEKRKVFFDRPPKGGTSSKHVRYAEERHGIGIADLDKIDLIRIGYSEDSLI
jgi:hypothetical protein